MIVDCKTCHAQYRLNDSMFRGARGMQVRCRSCGNSIFVLNPGGLAAGLAVLGGVAPIRAGVADTRRTSRWLSLFAADPDIFF